mmetsp:Transcript_11045/g.11138  ORF Transcript_11045/g.11138 Transcript_11045/m.11138 type:complete len:246 (-) Transcript_11045:700-1437(-)
MSEQFFIILKRVATDRSDQISSTQKDRFNQRIFGNLGLHVIINGDVKVSTNLHKEERSHSTKDRQELGIHFTVANHSHQNVTKLLPDVHLKVNRYSIEELHDQWVSTLSKDLGRRVGKSDSEFKVLVNLQLVLDSGNNFLELQEVLGYLSREWEANVDLVAFCNDGYSSSLENEAQDLLDFFVGNDTVELFSDGGSRSLFDVQDDISIGFMFKSLLIELMKTLDGMIIIFNFLSEKKSFDIERES